MNEAEFWLEQKRLVLAQILLDIRHTNILLEIARDENMEIPEHMISQIRKLVYTMDEWSNSLESKLYLMKQRR